MLALAVAVVLVLSDQWTKELVRHTFALYETRPLLDGFAYLTYVRNTGAAWGMFRGANFWLAMISLVTLLLLVGFRSVLVRPTRAHRVALGLLVGGIVGNLMDRLRLGYVTDFISLQFGRYEFPAFNLADSGITLAMITFAVSSWWAERRERRAPAPRAPDA
ncbi:MAG: signal peptidase II [Kiritimatiellae bacterium]|nr:signal peptidase II [Kiritimatiellia bacterium]